LEEEPVEDVFFFVGQNIEGIVLNMHEIVLKQREGIVAYDDAVLSYVAPQIIPTTTPNTFSVYVNATFDVAQDFIATVTVSLPELVSITTEYKRLP
jgi:hypothetical protein